MPLTPSRFALWGRMSLPALVAAAFFGPSIAAFATSRPVVSLGAETPPPIPVISVHPFLSLDYGSCTGDSPLHVGPTHQTSSLFYVASLRARMDDAAAECVGPSSGYLVLSVTVDKTAGITNVTADAGADQRLARCATTFMQRSHRLETRGPGTLQIGYFMGSGRT
jgi:hypothetical protein